MSLIDPESFLPASEIEATCAQVLLSCDEPLSHRLNALLFLMQRIDQERFTAFEPLLIALLNNPDEDAQLRGAVALSLGQSGSPEVFTALAAATQDGDPQVRQCVFEALGRLGQDAAVPLLLQGLYDPHNDVFLTAAEALGELSPASMPSLKALLDNPLEKHDVRCVAAWQLGKTQDDQALSSLIDSINAALSSDNPSAEAVELTALCVWALGEIGASRPDVTEALRQARGHGQSDIRERAHLALKKIARHFN